MATQNGVPRSMFCLTITAFKKLDLSDEDYHHYMTKIHAPLASELMEKYGIYRYTMTHNTNKTKALLAELYDPQFSTLSEYDCVVQFVFRTIQDFKSMKSDPLFLEKVAPDHVKFADTKRSTMTIGIFEEFLNEGKKLAKDV